METANEPLNIPEMQLSEDHPWLEVPDSSIDEDLRFTLDEIRFA